MEDAWVNEDRTKLATLEQLIGFVEEEIVRVEHDDTIIVHQAPCIELIEC